MSLPDRIKGWLLATSGRSIWVAIMVALAVGLAASGVLREMRAADLSDLLGSHAETRAAALQAATLSGEAMGVARMLGLAEPSIKSVVSGRAPSDDPAALVPLRIAYRMLDAEDVFVLDADGDVRLHVGHAGLFTGTNAGFRHYFKRGMRGERTVYAGFGTLTKRRGLYFAAPLWANDSSDSPVIGVVVIKLSGELLDRLLADATAQVFLVSPEGIVVAGTEQRWLSAPMLPPVSGPAGAEAASDDPEHARTTVSATQASIDRRSTRARERVHARFGYRPEQSLLLVDDEPFFLAISSLDWDDPHGDWRLVSVAGAAAVGSVAQSFAVGAAAGLVAFVLVLLTLRLVRSRQARLAAESAQQAAVTELAAASQAKTRFADFILASQKANELEGLATLFFRQLRQGYPLHQGTLYLNQPVQRRLRLIGDYAAEQAPVTIAYGEGLLGECALQRRAMVFDNPPDGFWRIRSGLSESRPVRLELLPLARKQRLIGILELASLAVPAAAEQALLEGLLPLLAIQLEIMVASGSVEVAGYAEEAALSELD